MRRELGIVTRSYWTVRKKLQWNSVFKLCYKLCHGNLPIYVTNLFTRVVPRVVLRMTMIYDTNILEWLLRQRCARCLCTEGLGSPDIKHVIHVWFVFLFVTYLFCQINISQVQVRWSPLHLRLFARNSNLLENLRFVIQLRAIRSLQRFAHATTTQLSWHVKNFVAITLWFILLELGLKKRKIANEFNCNGKK